MASKLRTINKFKTRGKISKDKQENKEKIKPNPPHINQANKSLKKLQKKRVKDILLERSKNLPDGENNKNIKKLLTRLSVDSPRRKSNINQMDIINNIPKNPPPPLPQEFKIIKSQETQDIYQNPNNNLSPKMLVNEINR